MSSGRHQLADGDEALEVESLPRYQRPFLEVRNHKVEDVLEPPGFPLERPVTSIGSDASASEVRLDCVQHLGALSVLTDGEAWPHLPSHDQFRAWRDGNGEASFSVDVTRDVRREELSTVPGAGV